MKAFALPEACSSTSSASSSSATTRKRCSTASPAHSNVCAPFLYWIAVAHDTHAAERLPAPSRSTKRPISQNLPALGGPHR